MRKTAFLLALLMILAIPVSAQADTMRASQIYPVLYFNGTTATCGVSVYGKTAEDAITATVKLWDGGTCLETWYPSGTGSLNFSGAKTVTSGRQYKLTVDATINGVALTTVSTTGTCP